MTPALMRIVLLVSLAHALVHVYEQALPSVEKSIAADLQISAATSGLLGTLWRAPFGLAALVAGWLTDRFGARRMLVIYLLGCAAMSAVAGTVRGIDPLMATMFLMGCFASIYHPAGLATIAHQTDPHTRGRALGWHGIFGSLGIAAAPLLASAAFGLGGLDWQQYYLLLVVPGVALALLLRWGLPADQPIRAPADRAAPRQPGDDSAPHALAFLLLVVVGAMGGFLYAAFTHFLARYLDTAGLRPENTSPESFRTLLSGIVLLCGAVGQGCAGRLARPDRLGWLLSATMLANAPCLLWMAWAEGYARLAATCLLALVHFAQQPIYNSLIPRYVPRHRLSTGYGFSNMMTFGVGALGPGFAGWVQDQAPTALADRYTYQSLAVVALVASVLALVLWRWKPDPARLG